MQFIKGKSRLVRVGSVWPLKVGYIPDPDQGFKDLSGFPSDLKIFNVWNRMTDNRLSFVISWRNFYFISNLVV